MFLTRRTVLGSAVTIAAAVAGRLRTQPSPELFDLTSLRRFIDPLPIPRVAVPSEYRGAPHHTHAPVAHYRVTMQPIDVQVHRDLPPNAFWGYAGACPGPTFDVKSGESVTVEWTNALPRDHMFTVDHSLHGAGSDVPPVRNVVHLHGGRVPPDSDGYPEHWITPGQSLRTFYPNQQEAATLFYHDHAMGITRLNTAAGLMGLYLVRDSLEASLNLPSGRYEIPLVLCDRSFHADGRLYYPVSGNPASPWVSEYYGGGILVNARLFPYLAVEPRKYRFRVLNTSNGSFYTLSFGADTSLASRCLPFLQIGSEQGLLPAPASIERLVLGPGERADVIVDFSTAAGRELYFRTAVTTVMQVRVSSRPVNGRSKIPSVLRSMPPLPDLSRIHTRELTLADHQDRLGRSMTMLLNGMHWSMPVTEKPVLGSTEIWSFINLTDDSHPIHLHLVRFRILDRRPYDLPTYQLTRKIVFNGPPQELDANECGWKDTVRVDPLTVTRILVRFEGFSGRYVWHCHMLEHEDNEMMRPYEILAAASPDSAATVDQAALTSVDRPYFAAAENGSAAETR